MLEYDNSAFYYFAITLLVIYLIPGTWYSAKELCSALFGSDIGANARTREEVLKASKIKDQTTGLKRLSSSAFLTNLACVTFAWAIFLYLLSMVSQDGEVAAFDPYVILGIEQGLSTGEIKKAYRKLSLQYHPDKNIGNKAAEEMFMKVAKAYEALTDETSKENYEKYGNPDGKQSLEVSIGLPSILLENPKVVLVLYLIAMVIVIPSVVGIWYSNSKQYGEKNIKYDTYNAFYTLLQDSYRAKNIPEMLAASAECREIMLKGAQEKKSSSTADEEAMGLLLGKMKNEKLMVKPKLSDRFIMKGNLLLHAHLLRLNDLLTVSLQHELDAILKKCSELVEGLIEIAQQRRFLQASLGAIKFSQLLVQSRWTNNHSLEQLPHFTDAEVKVVTKGPKPQAKQLSEYLRVPDSEKKGLSGLSDEQKQDVLKVCALLPNIKIETKLYVEDEEGDDALTDGEGNDKKDTDEDAVVDADEKRVPKGDEIYEQDLVTLRVTLTRENLPEPVSKKEKSRVKAAPVYAPHFPNTIYENWWIVLTDKVAEGASTETNIYAFEKVAEQGRTVTHEVRFMAPPKQGNYQMELQVLSNCYIGMDQTFPIEFDVRPASDLPEYQAHPEDLDLDNEPTLFEQVMNANIDDSSDEDDDDEEPEKEIIVRKGTRGGVVVDEGADSDDEDS